MRIIHSVVPVRRFMANSVSRRVFSACILPISNTFVVRRCKHILYFLKDINLHRQLSYRKLLASNVHSVLLISVSVNCTFSFSQRYQFVSPITMLYTSNVHCVVLILVLILYYLYMIKPLLIYVVSC